MLLLGGIAIDFFIIIITYPYSTCISSVIGSSIPWFASQPRKFYPLKILATRYTLTGIQDNPLFVDGAALSSWIDVC